MRRDLLGFVERNNFLTAVQPAAHFIRRRERIIDDEKIAASPHQTPINRGRKAIPILRGYDFHLCVLHARLHERKQPFIRWRIDHHAEIVGKLDGKICTIADNYDDSLLGSFPSTNAGHATEVIMDFSEPRRKVDNQSPDLTPGVPTSRW